MVLRRLILWGWGESLRASLCLSHTFYQSSYFWPSPCTPAFWSTWSLNPQFLGTSAAWMIILPPPVDIHVILLWSAESVIQCPSVSSFQNDFSGLMIPTVFCCPLSRILFLMGLCIYCHFSELPEGTEEHLHKLEVYFNLLTCLWSVFSTWI